MPRRRDRARAYPHPRQERDRTCHNWEHQFREPVAYTFAPETAKGSGEFDPRLERGGEEVV